MVRLIGKMLGLKSVCMCTRGSVKSPLRVVETSIKAMVLTHKAFACVSLQRAAEAFDI